MVFFRRIFLLAKFIPLMTRCRKTVCECRFVCPRQFYDMFYCFVFSVFSKQLLNNGQCEGQRYIVMVAQQIGHDQRHMDQRLNMYAIDIRCVAQYKRLFSWSSDSSETKIIVIILPYSTKKYCWSNNSFTTFYLSVWINFKQYLVYI